MAIDIMPVEDSDIPDLFNIQCLTFGANELAFRTFYPNFWTPEGRKAGEYRMLHSKQNDPETSVYHKAVDTETGKTVGFSIWGIYLNRCMDYPPKDLPPDSIWSNAEEAEFAKSLLLFFCKERSEYVASQQGNAVHLNILAVLPGYQRQGIGGKLMEWGLQKADELGFESWVESSAFGKGLYEKHGYVFQEDRKIETVEKFRGRETLDYALLIRSPGKGGKGTERVDGKGS